MQSPSIRKAQAVATKIDNKFRLASKNKSLQADANANNASVSDSNMGNNEDQQRIFVWNPSNPIPQLINIDSVCILLSLQKSAVYDLVARGLLEPPCKLSPGRRGASRWLLSSVVKFIHELANQRDLSASYTNETSIGEAS